MTIDNYSVNYKKTIKTIGEDKHMLSKELSIYLWSLIGKTMVTNRI